MDPARRPMSASPLPYLVAAAASAAAAAFIYLNRPPQAIEFLPLFASVALVLAAVGLWLAGRRHGWSEAQDDRAAGFDATSAAMLISSDTGAARNVNATAATLLRELGVDPAASDVLGPLGLAAQPEEDAGFIRLSGKVVRWRSRDIGAGHRVWQLDDVTEIVRGHAALQREVTTLQDIFDLMPLGFLSAGADGSIDRCNTTLADWLGETPVSMIGRSLGDFIIDASDAGEVRGVSAGMLTLRPSDGEPFRAALLQTARYGDDGTRPMFTRSLLIRDVALDVPAADDAPVETASDDDDIDLNGNVKWLFRDAPVGIAFMDMEGVIVNCNDAVGRLFGCERADLVSQAIAELVAPEDKDDLQSALSKVVMGVGQGVQIDAQLAHAQGREVSAAMTAARMLSPDGEPKGILLHLIDTTEHRSLEVQFTQSQKMQAVGQLAGGVAHDFNNLLTAMIGFSDLLLMRHGPDDPDFADIMQIKQNANRATNLVRQLLAFSRKQKLEPEVMDVSEALGDLSNLLGRLIGETVNLTMRHGRDLGTVLFDKGQFDQVIINLCVNARDAMDGNGKIEIVTKPLTLDNPLPKGHEIVPAGDYITIAVADTGSGIPKENLERIFEPFFSTKEVGAGTGLGLSTVYGIVHQANGFIFVDSASGKGTTFTIYLPVHHAEASDQPAAAPVAAEPEGDLTGHGTILLVEDEDAVRLFGARALRNKGYDVLEAVDGENALDVLRQAGRPIDLIVSDVVMPGMDGHTLVNLARQELPGVKTILMSGYSEDVFRNGPDMDSEIAFLGKPFTLKALAAKVRDVLDG